MATTSPRKQGWLDKKSVSAPWWAKNWRRRYLVLWDHGIRWYTTSEIEAASLPATGELRFMPETTVQRDKARRTLSISSEGRKLVVYGSVQQVQPHQHSQMDSCTYSVAACAD